jgi:cytidylate kinase
MRARPVVAIDGPAGAGKTTAARGVARALGYVLVDTGALYRAVAYAAKQAGLRLDDAAGVGALAHALVHSGRLALEAAAGEVPRVLLEGHPLGDEIRTAELSMGASAVSVHPEVRTALLELQRQFGARGGVVLEGRDIGTVVFPDAEVKVFLTATDEERASRRHAELQARGETVEYERILADVQARDQQDSLRALAPLRPAADAVTIECSLLSADEVVARIVALARAQERAG